MDKAKALDNLEKTVVAAATWEQDTGHRYAAIVTATAVCMDAECTRKEIAERLKRSSAGSHVGEAERAIYDEHCDGNLIERAKRAKEKLNA